MTTEPDGLVEKQPEATLTRLMVRQHADDRQKHCPHGLDESASLCTGCLTDWIVELKMLERAQADALSAAQRLMPFVHHDIGCMGGVCADCGKEWSHTNEWHFEHDFVPIRPCACGLAALLSERSPTTEEKADSSQRYSRPSGTAESDASPLSPANAPTVIRCAGCGKLSSHPRGEYQKPNGSVGYICGHGRDDAIDRCDECEAKR